MFVKFILVCCGLRVTDRTQKAVVAAVTIIETLIEIIVCITFHLAIALPCLIINR